MIIRILAWPLGQIMRLLYLMTENYGITIILFAVVIKMLQFPLNIMQQKNAIKMVRLQPQLNELNVRYATDPKMLVDEQFALYKREKYRPMLGLIPTLVQVPIIIGLINAVYNPYKWLLRIGEETIDAILQSAAAMRGVETLGSTGQLQVASMLAEPQYAQQFQLLAQGDAFVGEALMRMQTLDFRFCGWNLAKIPSPSAWGWLLAVPALAIASTLLLCILQNSVSVLSKEQGKAAQWGMTAFLTLFITAFAFLVPAGIGLYWAIDNFASIALLYLVNVLYPPKKYIDYETLEKSKQALARSRAAQKVVMTTADERKREKSDYKRFFSPESGKKALVFYSGARGTYKYYRSVIDYILAHSDIVIHYVASDPRDEALASDIPKLIPYYISGNNLIYFFMKLDADIVVMTMPEIEKHQYKRSLVRKDIEYIYMFHGVASSNLLLKKGALDYYDTIFCVGPSQYEELQLEEAVRGIKPRKLIQGGYSLIDETIASYSCMDKNNGGDAPQIMIAPSWHDDNILETCIDELLDVLLGRGYRIILRPHPEFVRRYGTRMDAIIEKYAPHAEDELKIDMDYTQNETVFSSDVLITDWSTVCYEFSFATKHPTLFINTPMKVMNPDYKELGNVPLDIRVRNDMGKSVDVTNIATVPDIIQEFICNRNAYRRRIGLVMDYALYNVGKSASVEANYIIEQATKKQNMSKETKR